MPRNLSLVPVVLSLCLTGATSAFGTGATFLSATSSSFGTGEKPVWLGPDGRPLPFESHDEATVFLRAATAIETAEISGSQNSPLKVLLEADGVRAHAVFRRVDRTWRREWIRGTWYLHLIDRAASERAAYVVARQLGIDNIPPTVLRELGGRRGTLQLWVEGAESLSEHVRKRREIPDSWIEQMAAIQVFDNLVFNVDRHPGNLLIRPDGVVWMIDHTQTFQYDERLLDADNVRGIPRTMWERLQEIPDSTFEEALAGALDDDQIEAFLERRRRLVEHIEALIGEHGHERVVRG